MINYENALVVFFSHVGENYFGGKIIDIKKGNTIVVAEKISKMANATLFEIVPIKKYPYIYSNCTAQAKTELQQNLRPEIEKDVDVAKYNLIFLGYPNWWGTMPMPVWTFLEKHNFKSKVIAPFCTHEGSGMGNSEKDLKKIVPQAIVKSGLSIYGSSVNDADEEISKWLSKLN